MQNKIKAMYVAGKITSHMLRMMLDVDEIACKSSVVKPVDIEFVTDGIHYQAPYWQLSYKNTQTGNTLLAVLGIVSLRPKYMYETSYAARLSNKRYVQVTIQQFQRLCRPHRKKNHPLKDVGKISRIWKPYMDRIQLLGFQPRYRLDTKYGVGYIYEVEVVPDYLLYMCSDVATKTAHFWLWPTERGLDPLPIPYIKALDYLSAAAEQRQFLSTLFKPSQPKESSND